MIPVRHTNVLSDKPNVALRERSQPNPPCPASANAGGEQLNSWLEEGYLCVHDTG